jgi:hypothetical protein
MITPPPDFAAVVEVAERSIARIESPHYTVAHGQKGWFAMPPNVAVLKFQYCRRKTHRMSGLKRCRSASCLGSFAVVIVRANYGALRMNRTGTM